MIGMGKITFTRSAPRLMQILRVLVRHKFMGALRGKDHLPPPKEVRQTFEELGLIFLKFGQVLAMRRDLLPDAYTKELELLHDQLPALDFHTVRRTVEADLGVPLAEVFSSFSETPMAAATIAQVHEAVLNDGRRVVVKVRRPDLEKTIATDIAALHFLITLGESFLPRLRALDLPVVVSEFADSLKREIDFSREADSIRHFRSALADVPGLWIPDVVEEHSTGNVLTMEFAAGERVDLYAKLHPEERQRSINTLVRLMLQSIFEEGLFHADPHPGNVLVLPDGRLSLVDFGMTGELDEPMRESLALLLNAVVNQDTQAATDAYLEMTMGSEKVNRAALMVDMKAVLRELHRKDLASVSIGDAFDSLLRAGTRHGAHNPGEFFLLTRTFVIMESLIRQLDPRYNYLEAFREEVARLTAKRFSMERIKEKAGKVARDMERLMVHAPGDAYRALRHFAEGNLGRLQVPAIEALGGRVSRDLKRLADAIAAAALLVGGSMLVNAPKDAGWHHYVGEAMVGGGVVATLLVGMAALRRDRGRGGGRR